VDLRPEKSGSSKKGMVEDLPGAAAGWEKDYLIFRGDWWLGGRGG